MHWEKIISLDKRKPNMYKCGIFYSPNYFKFIAETQGVDIVFFRARKNGALALLPYYVRNNTLFSLRYGGMISNSKSKEFARFVSDSFTEYCRTRKIRDVRIRNNPYIHTIPVGEVIKKEPLAFIDLNRTQEDLYAGISQGHKRGIIKAKNERLVVGESQEYKYLLLFYRLYGKLLSEKGKKPQDYVFFEKLYTHLKKNINLVYAAYNDRIVAVSIVLESKPHVFMLYGAMGKAGYRKYAKHLMIYEMMLRYKARGYCTLVLGTGVDGREDSIYRFKKGFGQQESHIHTYGTKL